VVDTLEVTRAPEHGIQKLGVDRQREARPGCSRASCSRDWKIARNPDVRHLDHGRAAALPRHPDRAARKPGARPAGEAAAPYVDAWLELSPFDRQAHELLLTSLARQRRIAEGEAHLASASKLFESDGLDSAPLRDIWRRARESTAQQPAPGPTIELVSASLTEISRVTPDTGKGVRRASLAVMPFVDRSSEADNVVAWPTRWRTT
jgi:hypothetical protein